MNMKKILAILMITILAGCGAKEGSQKEEQKTYVVGMSADFAPFEYRENGKIVGFDVELAQEIEKQTGVKLELQDIAFAGLLPAEFFQRPPLYFHQMGYPYFYLQSSVN